MTDYDPRTATGIPTEPVGSLPRPSWLQQAYAQYDAGQISRDQLEAEQDKAGRETIERDEARAGQPPGGRRRPVLRDLRRRPHPAAAPADRGAVPVQDLRRGHAAQVDTA